MKNLLKKSISSIISLKNQLNETVTNLFEKNSVKAAFHLPLIGTFAIFLFGLFLINKRGIVDYKIKQGVAVQIILPTLFAVVGGIRYILWFFDFESLSDLTVIPFYSVVFGSYLLMTVAFINIYKGKDFSYPLFEPALKKLAKFIFG